MWILESLNGKLNGTSESSIAVRNHRKVLPFPNGNRFSAQELEYSSTGFSFPSWFDVVKGTELSLRERGGRVDELVSVALVNELAVPPKYATDEFCRIFAGHLYAHCRDELK